MTLQIRHVAVLGAGTMGAAIAAHVANAGAAVDLLDVAPDSLLPEEERRGLTLESPEVRNRIVRAGFERMRQARPPALMSEAVARRIRLGNVEDDLERLRQADWIVEAIVEELEPKRQLMARVERVRREDAIVSSNTSGIPLHLIAQGRSKEFRQCFLGTHFFNPPRYLKLLELIPTADTLPEVVETIRDFATRALGKGTVMARDNPGFIANRLGVFASSHALRYALEHGYGVEEVDAMTGPLIGRPRTATFRLADQIGLDVMTGVADGLYEALPEDDARDEMLMPEPVRRMVEKGLLGLKTGAGFYRRTERDGKTVFDVISPDTLEYHPPEKPRLAIYDQAKAQGGLAERLRFLISKADEDRHARLVRDTLLPELAYASRLVPEISDSLADVDHAIEWGFGHEMGPFRTWDALGVRDTAELMRSLGLEVGGWVREMLESGSESFYRRAEGREQAYNPVTRRYEDVPADPDAISLAALRSEGREVAGNGSASLVDLGDGVLALELHAPASAIDQGVIEMGGRALQELEHPRWRGLVIASDGRNFCVGANLLEIGFAAQMGMFDTLSKAVEALQRLDLGLRYAPKPVVAAVRGQTLGGGAEIALHAARIVAAAETYMGLVETGVGLIPSGGGCKEMLRRHLSPPMRSPGAAPLPHLRRVFETIGLAKVSTSALEARELGYLSPGDPIVMHADHVLSVAKAVVLALAGGYRPPERGNVIYAAGRDAAAALEVGVWQMMWGRHISEYDGVIGRHLARVLACGDLSAPQWVPEEYVLGLERQAFLELLRNKQTLERMEAVVRR